MRTLPLLAALAFVGGALLSAAAFSAVEALDGGGSGGDRPAVMARLENTGSRDLQARILLTDSRGNTVLSETLTAPARTATERGVRTLAPGEYSIKVEWRDGETVSDLIDTFDTDRCDAGETLVVTFGATWTRSGISQRGGPYYQCRAAA